MEAAFLRVNSGSVAPEYEGRVCTNIRLPVTLTGYSFIPANTKIVLVEIIDMTGQKHWVDKFNIEYSLEQ